MSLAGLLTAIHKDHLRVINYRELLFNDFGDRVAQLLHVQSVLPLLSNIQQEIIIVNTHLLFPHDSSLSIVRLHQVYIFRLNNACVIYIYFLFLVYLEFSNQNKAQDSFAISYI